MSEEYTSFVFPFSSIISLALPLTDSNKAEDTCTFCPPFNLGETTALCAIEYKMFLICW